MGRGRLVREDQKQEALSCESPRRHTGGGAGWGVQGVAAGRPRPSVQRSGSRSQPVWLAYVCCAMKSVY